MATAMYMNLKPTADMDHISSTTNDDWTVTVLLSTFAGLGLPRTLSLPISASTSVQDVLQSIHSRLPPVDRPLIITTTDNKQLVSSNTAPVASLLSDSSDNFLPLRLSARICGGKGGFGSQLRAAGGRMSSRKKRDNQNVNGSSRNLQGHRLRVVAEAKRVTEALAKHDKEAKKEDAEKEKKRQEQIDSLENTIEQMKAGKLGGDKGRIKAEYVESKDLAEQQTRAAVLANYSVKPSAADDEVLGDAPKLHKTGSESSLEAANTGSENDEDEESSASSEEVIREASTAAAVTESSSTSRNHIAQAGPAFYGWDDDDDDDEEDD